MLTYTPTTIAHILNELRKTIVGQDDVIEQVLVAILAEGHALLEGVPGTAKTLMVKTLSEIIGARFSRIQFTPDLMPSDITGTNVFNMQSSEFTLRHGPIFTDILLADEINRTPPKTQAALLEAMEERQTTIDGERYPLSPMFTVLATENPIEYEGTYPLPEAQLDRFLLKILIDYPDLADEQEVVARWDAGFNSHHLDRLDIQQLPDAAAISHCRHEVRNMRMEPGVQKYIVEIVRRSRSHPTILYGASPRASIALLLCSKALAAIRGREFPTPDDVRDIAAPVLRHRLALRAEAELEGATTDAVVSDILRSVEVPR
ncbi:MAG: MoxR family ATPase [Blastocatellia bacterium]|nr:MoxR family ATPase [Chloracidobacterium sp.]MBL8183687.1 MoxR family ATPase [Blastocatellia bacterium]HBE81704.1 magnesium chelatase [Blastocatellia bacterium]HRJ87264.1 MoxR family ATPase [Pyrinomonadaceae bacterium]HRK50884.1 MoxR family ATPase [Pyrinomonadaceae bacterium]